MDVCKNPKKDIVVPFSYSMYCRSPCPVWGITASSPHTAPPVSHAVTQVALHSSMRPGRQLSPITHQHPDTNGNSVLHFPCQKKKTEAVYQQMALLHPPTGHPSQHCTTSNKLKSTRGLPRYVQHVHCVSLPIKRKTYSGAACVQWLVPALTKTGHGGQTTSRCIPKQGIWLALFRLLNSLSALGV